MSNGEPGSALAVLDGYRAEGGYNVLSPVVSLEGDAVSSVLVESVQVVAINAAEDSGEVYHDWRYAPPPGEGQGGRHFAGKYALSALGLAKIAAAAGVKWHPELCRVLERQRRPDGHVYLRYQACGAVRQPNGEWHLELAEKEIDTADWAEQREDTFLEQIRAGRNKDRRGNVKFTEEDVPAMVRRDLLQLREHLLGHAETKAKNRVIRRLLTLKQVYTEEEIARPFVVPRLLYRPDVAELVGQVQVEGRTAAQALYGEQAAHALPVEAAAGQPVQESSVGEGSEPEPPEPPGWERESIGPGTAGTGSEEEAPATESPPAPEPSGPPAPSQPKADPAISDGPHEGKQFSQVAVEDPAYLEAIAHEARHATRRSLAQEWLDYVAQAAP